MRHHLRIFAAIAAGALLILFAACQGDPDPFGTLDRLIEQPSHASDLAEAVRRAYNDNAALYALEYRNRPVTVYGVMRQRGEDWAQIYRQVPNRYRIRCEFSDHVSHLADARLYQEVTFQGEMFHIEAGVLTVRNCRSPG